MTNLKLPLTINELLHYLPHRHPFIFVDRVTELSAGNSITAIKNITITESFFAGHFPNNPVMPGVLMLEALAQTSGILAFETTGHRPSQGYNLLFAGVDAVKFKRVVIPGDILTLKAKLVLHKRMIFKFECHAFVGDELAVCAEITLAELK